MSKTDAIDLASLSTREASDKGFELELRHPVTDAPLGVFITVVGNESEKVQSRARQKANETLRQNFANQRRGKDAEAPTVEKAIKNAIEDAVAGTVSWRTGDKPTITWDGKPLDLTENNARLIYAERWVREQVSDAMADLGNFMPV